MAGILLLRYLVVNLNKGSSNVKLTGEHDVSRVDLVSMPKFRAANNFISLERTYVPLKHNTPSWSDKTKVWSDITKKRLNFISIQLPSLLQYPSDRTKQFVYLNKQFNFRQKLLSSNE